ncbi:unnamed protein product, partial [Pleuronectes platessa]
IQPRAKCRADLQVIEVSNAVKLRFIVSANLVIILVISRERSLHEPMYMFIALLSVNSLCGATGFFPRFLMDLVSDSHLISRPACFTQIYVIYTYAGAEMTILGIMAYDRYVAVWFCDIALSRYDPDELNPFVAVILSLEFVVIPPVLNPLVYGLKLPEIRRHIIQPRAKCRADLQVIEISNGMKLRSRNQSSSNSEDESTEFFVADSVWVKMENGTDSFYFKFTMFVNIGSYYYVAFVFSLLLYSFIVSANLVIILVISRERSLHEPMYMFIASLSVNSLYGSTGFFPRFLMDLVSDSHLISRPACFTQIYVIYTPPGGGDLVEEETGLRYEPQHPPQLEAAGVSWEASRGGTLTSW